KIQVFDNDGGFWRAAVPGEQGKSFFQAEILIDNVEIPEDDLNLVFSAEFFNPGLPFPLCCPLFNGKALYPFAVDAVQKHDLGTLCRECFFPEPTDVMQKRVNRRVRDNYEAGSSLFERLVQCRDHEELPVDPGLEAVKHPAARGYPSAKHIVYPIHPG